MGQGDKENAGIFLQNNAGETYVVDSGTSKGFTAGTLLKITGGVLKKIIVNSHTTGKWRLFDNNTLGAVTNPIGGTFAAATGSGVYDYEVEFYNGINVAVEGTVDLTAVFK